MFPTVNYFFEYLFGWSWGMNFPPTFGFIVALAFIAAAIVLSKELKRKEKDGLVHSTKRKVMEGEPAKTADFVSWGIFGFITGFKVVAIILGDPNFRINPQGFILSAQGNFFGGIVIAAAFVAYIYYQKKKKALPTPVEKEIEVHPYQLVGNITFYAAIFGIIGAKIFHQLEYWDNFIQDPIGNLVSASGLTFYGGLIGGFFGVWYYLRKNKLPLMVVADCVAPGLILAYAIGRLGCMCAGDGDWGIINSAYRITDDRQWVVAAPERIESDLHTMRPEGQTYAEMFAGNGQPVDYAYFKQPKALSFLPKWMFAYDYPHNVNEEGIHINGCNGTQYCNRLPLPVFPTPIYETTMGIIIFFILWGIRKRLKIPGLLFFAYLILNGIERFFIEKIRVNSELILFGMKITQAELIAMALILIGILGLILVPKFKDKLIKL